MIKENFLVCQEEAMTKRSMVINMYLQYKIGISRKDSVSCPVDQTATLISVGFQHRLHAL